MVLKNPLENLTVNGTRRSDFTFGVPVTADLDAVRSLAVTTMSKVEGIRTDPAPEAYVDDLSDSKVTIRVRFWHAPLKEDRWVVRSRVIEAVLTAMKDADIELH